MTVKPTILIVEDDQTLREELTGALEDSGYDACAVGSAEDALERVVDRWLESKLSAGQAG